MAKAVEGLSDRIRVLAREKHVEPARRSGQTEFSIRVRDLIDEAEARGLPTKQSTPPYCTSIQTGEFLRDNGVEITRVDGPRSKLSTTVVVHYRFLHLETTAARAANLSSESAEEKAYRLTEKLRGLLKDELAAYGGGEAFLRWVRSENEDAA